MIRTVTIAVAVAIGIGAAAVPGIVSGVEARAALPTTNAAAKADRLDLLANAPDCSQQVWPYFEPRCLRRAEGGKMRAVRIVDSANHVTGVK